MSQEAIDSLVWKLEDEGFDYTFEGYSDWEEIDDKSFHDLRLRYLFAKDQLQTYIDVNFKATSEEYNGN